MPGTREMPNTFSLNACVGSLKNCLLDDEGSCPVLPDPKPALIKWVEQETQLWGTGAQDPLEEEA